MNSKNILITIASLALILLAIGVQAHFSYNSNSATATLNTSATLAGTTGFDTENESHCSKTFLTSTYFKDEVGVSDPMIVTWSAPATLPSSCVGDDMVFDSVDLRITSSGGHWSQINRSDTSSSGTYHRNKKWVNGDVILTQATFNYILD